MQTLEAIRHMCDKSGKGIIGTSTAIGRTRTFISNMLTRGSDPRVGTLMSIAEANGYRLVLESDGERIVLEQS